jgi:hypothetical protein
VESKPKRTGKVHTTAVSSGPQEQLKECRTKLDGELQKAVAAYVDWYLGRFYGDEGKPSQFVRYDLRFIRDHLVRPENNHEEKLELSFGPMYQAHALVSFDPEFRKQLDAQRPAIERQWKQRAVKGRLAGTGLVFGVILFLLAVVSGYFRLDTATRGYYTGRLQLLAAAAILAVVIAGAILAKGVPWM